MMEVRKSEQRGHASFGWLESRHSFSFGGYYDPKFMGFRSLRVINEDWVDGDSGFPTHPHRDMEIITYIVSGALEHKDTLGSAATILPGEVQVMTAGTGIQHSEFNPSLDERTHLLQIWIEPAERGLAPEYRQKSFSERLLTNGLVLVGSQDGREDSVLIHQDVNLYLGRLQAGHDLPFDVRPNRHIWIQIIKGRLDINGTLLEAGDGLALSHESKLHFTAKDASEFLVFDLQ